MQPWNVPSVGTGRGHPHTQVPHAYHHASKPASDAISGVVSQPSAVEVKPTGRNELPEVLITPYFTLQSMYFVHACMCL